jgi:hypothetical protein
MEGLKREAVYFIKNTCTYNYLVIYFVVFLQIGVDKGVIYSNLVHLEYNLVKWE